jgi:hypothetical protein
MRVLISIKDKKEASEVLAAGGVDILDIKNPGEGTLGANKPWIIKEVMQLLPRGTEVAASIGDLDYKPGTASLAAYGVARLGVDYVVASFYGVKTCEQAEKLSRALKRALAEEGGGVKLIISGYADYWRTGSANPFEFVKHVSCDVIMLDTAVKDGQNILDFASVERLREFVDLAHERGMETCISGSLRIPHLERAVSIGSDILGFRGAACEAGVVKRSRVEELLSALRRL